MTLRFEDKWEKTISESDRKLVYEVYERFPIQQGEITFAPVRVAVNHRGDLLATVLVLNGLQDEWTLEKRNICYVEGDEVVAEECFTHHSLIVQAESAIPWTFIFKSSASMKALRLTSWEIIFLERDKLYLEGSEVC